MGKNMGEQYGGTIWGNNICVVTKFEITVLEVLKLEKTIPQKWRITCHTLPKRSVGISWWQTKMFY
jgi:hypothetical protein